MRAITVAAESVSACGGLTGARGPWRAGAALATGLLAVASASVSAQQITAEFECAYTFDVLGFPASVFGSLGGLVFSAEDPDVLLIGGAANAPQAAIYAVPVTRDGTGRVTGFAGPAMFYASAPNIDGGLTYAPGDVLLFSRYSMNNVGQLLPGSTTPDRDIPLSPLGFTGSVGALAVVPAGFPGAGRLKVFPFNSSVWHDAAITPDGNGTFDISAPTNSIPLLGGPEGIVYVEAGSPQFSTDSVLISEYSAQSVSAYRIDANGDPVPGTRRVFMTGLPGAEGGTRDPVTGDFLFSTFGGGAGIVVVRGFNPDCRGNFNGVCAVNVFDILEFLTAWNAFEPRADWDESGSINIFDILAFLNAWNACD
jgi:hypothetical protein